MNDTLPQPKAFRPEILAKKSAAFLSGGTFPAFAISALFFYQVFIAIMAFSPGASGLWGNFIEDFRYRCFKVSASGSLEMGSVWVMLSEPLPLQLIFLGLWLQPLRDLWKNHRRVVFHATGFAFFSICLIAASLLALGRAHSTNSPLPFPADRLRSALPMPQFSFIDQDEQPVTLNSFKDRVVLVTAIYATCTTTCPMMLTKIRSVLDQLTPIERTQLDVLAFSLKPETDTRELRKITSKLYGMNSPQFHFVNGNPAQMDELLDQLNIARLRDDSSGQVMHSSLFILLDRQSRIAYRLSLSDTEQSWLISAVRTLIAEGNF